MSNNPKIIHSVLKLMREKYSHAQKSFLLIEIFEQFHARRSIKKLAEIFEILSEAIHKDQHKKINEAEKELEEFATENFRYLCHVRFKEILRLRSWHRWCWYVFFLKYPFGDKHIVSLIKDAGEKYGNGIDNALSFNARIDALDHCFMSLEKALALIRPHQIYNRIFSFIIGFIFLLAGTIIGELVFKTP